jgi:hypothetical protein
MVQNIPAVNVSKIYGYVNQVAAYDQVFGCVIECNKGSPAEAQLISSPQQLLAEYGVTMDPYWGVGGQPLYIIRAVDGITTQSVDYLYDTETSPVPIIKLVAQVEGSYNIFINAGPDTKNGNDLVLEEPDNTDEFYLGVHSSTYNNKSSIETIVDNINTESAIVDAYYQVLEVDGITTRWDNSYVVGETVLYGNDTLAVTGRVILGTNSTMGSVGSDGTVKELADQAEFDLIPDEDAAMCHRKALQYLEDVRLAGVFTMKAPSTEDDATYTAALYGEYASHAAAMTTPREHMWRYVIVGADDNSAATDMEGMINFAKTLNSENVIYVGQGVVDVNGVEYTPRMATQVVAGKLGYTAYQEPIWGGASSKVLAANNVNFIADVMFLPGSGITNVGGTPLTTFTKVTGYTNIYSTTVTTAIGNVNQDLTVYTEIPGGVTADNELSTILTQLDKQAGFFFFDEANNLLYINTFDSGNPNNEIISMNNLPGPASSSDRNLYNTYGVLTFLSRADGIRVLEGINTAQNENLDADSEIAVIRIVNHAQYVVFDTAYQLLGGNISDTYYGDMTTSINSALSLMVAEGALVDVPSDGLVAFTVNVEQSPRTLQREGVVNIQLAITPAHAARTIKIQIVVM